MPINNQIITEAEREPKRVRRRRTKPGKEMSSTLKELGDAATKRHFARSATPEIKVGGDQFGEGWTFHSPYRPEDRDQWEALLFDAFATRSHATFTTFTTQLSRLCATRFDHEAQQWRPDEDELVAAIQIVRSLDPRNEAEAAYAAQAIALHIAAMKLGEQIGRSSWPEPRTVAILAKTTRAYGSALETLARLKGGSSSKQTIEVHHHEHKHIHVEGSADEFGEQPHATGGNTDGNACDGTCKLASCPALPRPDSLGNDLPFSSSKRPECVPDARGKRIRRPEG